MTQGNMKKIIKFEINFYFVFLNNNNLSEIK